MTAATASGESWRLGYRPALTGTRGVAVLVVMGYHWALPGLHGGDVTGVALFFALSGFLITALLLEERARTGAVDLFAFYRRRARRLLPALFVLVSAVMASAALLGRDVSLLSPLAAIGYVANWAWWFHLWDMGPLAHTWTLSVEEQFYLVWPAALLLALRPGRRRVVAILLAALLTVAEFQAGIALLAGCLLAIGIQRGRLAPLPMWVGLLALTGLGLLTVYPVGDMALAGYLAALLIGALIGRPSALTLILSWRPMVYVGTISYGLYLWHVALGWFLTPYLPSPYWIWGPSFLTLLSFAAAIASWHLIEQPFQRRTAPRLRTLMRRRPITAG